MIDKLVSFYIKRKGKAFLEMDKWESHTKLNSSKNIALYIHIPFCKEICHYCSFTKFAYEKDVADEYFKSLKKEIKIYKNLGFDFSNAYFGGGTPSIDMQKLLELIYLVKSIFSIKDISVELKIDDLTEKNISLLKSAGVTRVSVGVQSFEESNNKTIGRNNKSEKVFETLKLANEGFKTLNVDLIFNMPNQSIESIKKDIEIITKLGVSQVTFYPLMPNYNETKFSKIDTSKEKIFYETIVKDMTKNGFTQSSIWCFDKNKSKSEEYFVDNDEYIGVGCGAISFSGKEARVNSFSLEKYSKSLAHEKLPIILHKKLSEKEFLDYYLLTKSFGLNFDRRNFKKLFGKEIEKINRIKVAKKMGYLTSHKENLTISKKGKYHVSVLMKEFFSSLNLLRNKCSREKL